MTFLQNSTPSSGFYPADEGPKDAEEFQAAWAYEVYVAILGLRNASETVE